VLAVFPPPKRKTSIEVFIPASLLEDSPDLKMKTMKLGFIARAFAIYRVDKVVIYPDRSFDEQYDDMNFIELILSYMKTPQYLRKHVYPLMPELRYVGLLPPLATPNHPLARSSRDISEEYREGFVLKIKGGAAIIDAGLERYITLKLSYVPSRIKVGDFVLLRVYRDNDRISCEVVDKNSVSTFLCYDVQKIRHTIGKYLQRKRNYYDLIIATSRYGVHITKIMNEIKGKLKNARTIAVLFGGPYEGLFEILKREGLRLDEVTDFIINTIPYQGTRTVRTEEAIHATLAILNIIMQ